MRVIKSFTHGDTYRMNGCMEQAIKKDCKTETKYHGKEKSY
jgi:hypothetical protein